MCFTLALDCSAKNITLAVIEDDKILSSFNDNPPEPQSALGGAKSAVLLGVIDDILRASGVDVSKIKNVLFCHGPGSFTSLRVGLATLKGLFHGSPISYFQASSLLFRCLSLKPAPRIVSVIPVGRARLAVGILESHVSEAGSDVSGINYFEKIFTKQDFDEFVAGRDCVVNDGIVKPEGFLKILKGRHFDKENLSRARLNYLVSPDMG